MLKETTRIKTNEIKVKILLVFDKVKNIIAI